MGPEAEVEGRLGRPLLGLAVVAIGLWLAVAVGLRAGHVKGGPFVGATVGLVLTLACGAAAVALWRRRPPGAGRSLLVALLAYHAAFGQAASVAALTPGPTRNDSLLVRGWPHVVDWIDGLA